MYSYICTYAATCAPQLSSTYAEYDDGANVFLIYFNGNTPTSDFVVGGGDTVTQETGISLPNGNTGNVLRFTTGSSEAATTVDMFTTASLPNNPDYYIAQASFQSDGSGIDMEWGLAQDSGTATSDNAIFAGTQYGGAYFDEAYVSNGTTTHDINGQGATTTSWRYSSLTYNSSSSYYAYIAPQLYSTSGGYSVLFRCMCNLCLDCWTMKDNVLPCLSSHNKSDCLRRLCLLTLLLCIDLPPKSLDRWLCPASMRLLSCR